MYHISCLMGPLGRINDNKVDTKGSNYLIELEHCMLTLFSALCFKEAKPEVLP